MKPRELRDWAPALAIVAAGLLAWWPAFSAGFVWDDGSLVEENPLLRGPLWRLWFTASAKDYWPLTWTSFWIEWRLWGGEPAGFHVTNVVLHLLAALLVWRVLRALEVPGAALAALLFAVHPVAVESVAWISERKNTLSGVLFLLSLLVWIRGDEGRRPGALAGAVVLFALALLAKSSVVALPLVLLGIAWFRRGRVSGAEVRRSLPFFALSLLAGLATVWFQHRFAMGGAAPRSVTAGERIGGAGWALASYLQKAFVPIDLGVVYPPWPVRPESPLFFVPALALLAGATALWLLRRRRPFRAVLAATGFHALLVAPVLGFVDMAYFSIGPVSNHLQYLALLGPLALWGAGLSRVLDRAPPLPARAMAAALVVALALYTHVRARAFHDERSLWARAVAEQPRSAVARLQLATLLLAENRREEALQELDFAARHAPDAGLRHSALALRHLHSGEAAPAAAEAREVLRSTEEPDLRRDAALVLLATGRSAEGIAELERLVAGMPQSADFTYWLAAALLRHGRPEEARALLRRFVAERPGVPRTEEALAFLLVREGQRDEALARAAAVQGVDPAHPRALEQLRLWLAQPGWEPGR